MQLINIRNTSAGALVRSYAVTPDKIVVWLELAPQHPKQIGAIWASLVDGGGEWLRLLDEDPDREEEPIRSLYVRGLHRRYHRLSMDAPRLAGRARPQFLRLVAPELCAIAKPNDPFGVLAWPGTSPGTALAAMLEQGTKLPMRLGWGDYLLAEAISRGHGQPLTTGGPAPAGYWFAPTPWEEIISEGVRAGHLTLDGGVTAYPIHLPVLEPAYAVGD